MKQVILIRSDLKLPKGKIAVQCSHASVEAALKSKKSDVLSWRSKGMKKVVLKVKDLTELKKYYLEAKKAKIVTSLIKDAGLTTVPPGTITCVGIGPDKGTKIDKITRHLKML